MAEQTPGSSQAPTAGEDPCPLAFFFTPRQEQDHLLEEARDFAGLVLGPQEILSEGQGPPSFCTQGSRQGLRFKIFSLLEYISKCSPPKK